MSRLLLAGLLAGLFAGCTSWRPTFSGFPGSRAASGVPANAPPELDYLVGRDLELDGEVEEALAAYKRALEKDPDSPELLRKVAELSARTSHLEDAVAHAERAYALDPADRSTRLFLGTLYRFLREPARVEQVLREPNGQPFDADAALLLYGTLTEADRFDEALAIAKWLVAHEPDALRGWFALADAYEKLGDFPASERTLREGLKEHPGELALYGALARSRRDRDDRDGEIAIYKEMLVVEPGHQATLLSLAEALIQQDKLAEAIPVLEEVERAHPDDLRTILRLGFLEFESRDYKSARHRFEQALALNPDQPEVSYFLGITLRRLDLPGEAIAAFEAVPDTHERFPEARTQIAGIYEKQGDYARAIAEVERARSRGEARPLDLYVASLRSRAGDFDGALEFLRGLLQQAPDDAELLYNLGVIHGEAKRTSEALEWMEKALAKQPDHAGALNYIGYSWAEKGTNLDQAEKYISRALELKPDDGYITDSLAWVYYMRARALVDSGHPRDARRLFERAIRELEKANELTGGDPVISEHMGDVYLSLGRKDRALEKYQEALTLDPRDSEQPQLREKHDRLRRELGRP
ncbi:MAG TPA: tetratricopeptide repeat protein [Myxococcota bacterium]|nr:tetratricopeptide repeat protein [Myxococcota bacterium]